MLKKTTQIALLLLSTIIASGSIGYLYSQIQSSQVFQPEINSLKENLRELVIENNETRRQLGRLIELDAVLSETSLSVLNSSSSLLQINEELS